ncbi:hypothetical protein AXF42_Ash000891 [Apostasia shenzhenica]|uniref:ATG8-interacting protein 1 n=1 Tax=Apostasia shenzhenica TaxID=1088818 RepID=A0A2I0ATC1_9ASPA|nr:hypothetical protein AXF42_Ash000891 [Apostasia shenzhenica]
MADDVKATDENPSKGTDWEVVSLTASTYAATPGSNEYDPSEQHKNEFSKTEQEYSGAMFMSKHFIFLAGEPEHVVEPDCCESHKEQGIQCEEHMDPENFTEKKEKLDSENDLHGSKFFDKTQTFSDHGLDFGDGRQVDDKKLLENSQAFYISSMYNSLHKEPDVSQSIHIAEGTTISEPEHSYPEEVDYTSENSSDLNVNEKSRNKESDHSHEAWWKKRAMSIYHHARETNTFWSIFVAVAVAGLVILGKRWSREKSYFQQPKWKFGSNDEKTNAMAAPLGRFKGILAGHQQASMRRGLHPAV